MANVVVVGAQWGDEGKGKIVDWLTDHAKGVVRFQGGHNAGHTLVVGDKEKANGAVAVRARGNLDLGVMPLADFQQKLLGDIALKT